MMRDRGSSGASLDESDHQNDEHGRPHRDAELKPLPVELGKRIGRVERRVKGLSKEGQKHTCHRGISHCDGVCSEISYIKSTGV